MEKDGVFYGLTYPEKGMKWDQEKSRMDVCRGDQRHQETLTISATAGGYTLEKEFPVTIRAIDDPVVDYEIYPCLLYTSRARLF